MSTYEVIDIEDTQASVTVGGMPAAITLYRDDQLPDEEWLAACLLIKSAPEMLDALTAAYAAITYMMSNDDCGGAPNALEQVVAAIAKAEGRE